MTYIEVIKQIMITHNYTQKQFADTIDVNQTTVSQWLLGHKKPGYDSIYAIYEKFGVTPNELFGIE